MMDKPLNPWQPTTNKIELALLGKLLEELGEATQAAARCVIQGINENEPVTGMNNRVKLLQEIADVAACSTLVSLYLGGDIEEAKERCFAKIAHLKAWHAMLED